MSKKENLEILLKDIEKRRCRRCRGTKWLQRRGYLLQCWDCKGTGLKPEEGEDG